MFDPSAMSGPQSRKGSLLPLGDLKPPTSEFSPRPSGEVENLPVLEDPDNSLVHALAIFRNISEHDTKQETVKLSWNRIRPFKGQPREYFDQGELENLANSIAAIGQLQPVLLVKIDGDPECDYELVDGQRRWHAVQMAGKEEIRGIVLDLHGDQGLQYIVSFVSNFGRADHTPDEAAKACCKLREQGFSIKQIAHMVGKSEGWVNIQMRLTKVNEELFPLLRTGELPVQVAYELTKIAPDHQEAVFQKIKQQPGKINARTARHIIAETLKNPERRNTEIRVREVKPSDTQRLAQSFISSTQERLFDLSQRDLEGAFLGASKIAIERARDSVDDLIRRLEALKRRLPPLPNLDSD